MALRTMHGFKALAVSIIIGVFAQTGIATEGFTLLRAVPEDAVYCVAGRYNTERKFLEDYWAEVLGALKQSGIGTDVMTLFGSSLGESQRTEVDRLKARASELINGVNWKSLRRGETAFAERLNEPVRAGGGITLTPEMVLLIRGTADGASSNYDGLVAILQAITDEINTKAGNQVLTVAATASGDAKVARLNLAASMPQAPPFSLAVALHKDVIAISAGQKILDDVLSLLGDESSKKSLSNSPRFQKAFSNLPKAEDGMTFFDVQALLRPVKALAVEVARGIGSGPKDRITNAHINQAADELAAKGIAACQQQDHRQALELTRQAHEAAPTDSRIMYNLACFHALSGNKEDALTWLDKAVTGGFFAPKQIADDGDLVSLRGDPRYEAALATATRQAAAAEGGADEAARIKWIMDRVTGVLGMLDYVAAVEYTEGFAVHGEQIVTLVPGAADKPFYPVFGKRKPLDQFDRYLPQETSSFSVSGGIDAGELYRFVEDSIRGGPRGEQLLAQWTAVQQKLNVDFRRDVLGWIDGHMIDFSMTRPGGEARIFMLKVTDEAAAREKVNSALNFLSSNLKQAAQSNPMLAMLAIRVSPAHHEKLTGFQNIFLGVSPQPMVCGVADGYLIFGSSIDAIALSLATAAGEHPGVRKNARMMAEALIPGGAVRSISFTDRRNFGAEMAQIIGMVSMSGGIAAMAIPNPEAQRLLTKILGIVAKLGPVAQKINFYKSSARYSTFDGTAWRARSVTNYKSPAERKPPAEPKPTSGD